MISDTNKDSLFIIKELVAELESIALKEHLNIDVKIYDVDYERNSSIKFDIPQ